MARSRSRRPTAALAPLAVASLLLLGCGGDDDAAAPSPAPEAPAPDETGDAATAEIVISGFAYSELPPIPAGTTVIVRNDDTAPHTFSSTDDVFSSGSLGTGDTFSFTFDEPGEYPFFCQFHPSMTGTVVVTD